MLRVDNTGMRAMAIPEFGDPDVLRMIDVLEPEPGPGQIAIDVAYAGANYAEVLYRRGGVDVPLPYVPGIEVAGHVREMGDGVEHHRVGEPVAALTIVDGGGYAEVAISDAALVAPFPADEWDDLALAAATPSNSTTALLVFEDVARMREGETVLVHAAAGGVGSSARRRACWGPGRLSAPSATLPKSTWHAPSVTTR